MTMEKDIREGVLFLYTEWNTNFIHFLCRPRGKTIFFLFSAEINCN